MTDLPDTPLYTVQATVELAATDADAAYDQLVSPLGTDGPMVLDRPDRPHGYFAWYVNIGDDDPRALDGGRFEISLYIHVPAASRRDAHQTLVLLLGADGPATLHATHGGGTVTTDRLTVTDDTDERSGAAYMLSELRPSAHGTQP